MAKKILSFEEYATNQGLGDKTEVSEEDLDDCPCGHDEEGNCKECEEGGEPEPEEEIEDDSDDDSDEDDSDDDDSEEAPEEAEGEEVGTETVATVEEMLTEGYNKVKEAACAYENDEYQDHTLEMYMKENAALVAALAAKSMEEGYDEVKETDMTQEMYEALCNEMQESYCKKIEELKEAYSAGKE
jgi:hypothetical protein